jgi:hypothetical protein
MTNLKKTFHFYSIVFDNGKIERRLYDQQQAKAYKRTHAYRVSVIAMKKEEKLTLTIRMDIKLEDL